MFLMLYLLLIYDYFSAFFTFYLRYRQIAEFYRNHSSSSTVIRLNNASLLVGSLAALGISLAANFQETHVYSVHIIGALMAFGGGTIYLWLQVCPKISFQFICSNKNCYFTGSMLLSNSSNGQ